MHQIPFEQLEFLINIRNYARPLKFKHYIIVD